MAGNPKCPTGSSKGDTRYFLEASTPQGIPQELFASAEPRWLSVQAQLPEENERPRVLLVSVPYALQAENAQTLGGLPPSAFVRVAPTSSSSKGNRACGCSLQVSHHKR